MRNPSIEIHHIDFLTLSFSHFVPDSFYQMSEFPGLDSLFYSFLELEAIIGVVTFFFVELTVLGGVLVFSAFGERPGRPKVLFNFFCCKDFLRGLCEGCETYAVFSA
ncbi:hypothetical protein HanRHA438_Chr02g0054651 [Helianthus annuus]|nr:hypothetical protein HanRHA438_Chr02g0054651 [Helianthus annuus]